MAVFGFLSPKKESKRSASLPSPSTFSTEFPNSDILSPELVPIVTLLLAQNHRRYYEGVFMLYYDLSTDGKSGDRIWKEVYGILTGNQLAYWDALNLAQCRDKPEKLLESSCRPQYLNFLDAVFNAMAVLPTAKLQLENVIVVLTTLKNRFILQLRTPAQMQELLVALRLAAFEYQALQEAYTGALLSARGLQLSDIRTILSPTRYNHSEWVKIRYGSGTAWKRCYMVIEPLIAKRKGLSSGKILIYENDTCKKKDLLGEITSVTSLCAVYPQLHFFIDKSTMMKLEGKINFKQHTSRKKSNGYEADTSNPDASLFIMPEEHHSVPGYDTLIRFIFPLFDAFGQYGRPKRLKADRMDPESLLFALPTLPCIYYLEVEEVIKSMSLQSQLYIEWDTSQWRSQIKILLSRKLSQGYNGCGSTKGLHMLGQASVPGSPRILSPLSGRFPAALSPSPTNNDLKGIIADRLASAGAPVVKPQHLAGGVVPNLKPGTGSSGGSAFGNNIPSQQLRYGGKIPQNQGGKSQRNDLAEIYQNYTKLQTPSDNFNDRNKILNGAEEEFDESKLPTLMRKKSLMHGPYPTRDKFIGESDSEENSGSSEEDEDEEDEGVAETPRTRQHNGGSAGVGNRTNNHGPQLTGRDQGGKESNQFLAPNNYEERNSSYSSVQSPNTQYQEFNKQFSKSFPHPAQQNLAFNNSDDESGTESEEEAPAPPTHGGAARSNFAGGQGSQPRGQTGGQGTQPHIYTSDYLKSQNSFQSLRLNGQPPLTPALGERFANESPQRGNYRNLPADGSKPGMLSPADDNFAHGGLGNGPRYIRAPNQQHPQQAQALAPQASGNRAPNQYGNSMQSMNSKFQQTSLDSRGQGQGQGPSPTHSNFKQGPQPINQGQYNMQQPQQGGAYQGAPGPYSPQQPQSGSPQQRGQYMQRPPQQYGMPPRPQNFGSGPRSGPPQGGMTGGQYHSQFAGPPPNQYNQGGYRGPNPQQGQVYYGNPKPGQMAPGPSNMANMPSRPHQGQQLYSNNPGFNQQGYGQQPRPAVYSQQLALSMRSADDQQQYQYQVNPNFAPRRMQPPSQGQYPNQHSSSSMDGTHNPRYQ